jgi:hypothetical protein
MAEVEAARAALIDINNSPYLRNRLAGRLMATINQLFGKSPETESNWVDCLSLAHLGFILEFVERRQASEEAVIDKFLASRDTSRIRS